MTLSRRGFLIVGGSAAAVTLVGNAQVLAAVAPGDRYDRLARGAQELIETDGGASSALRDLRLAKQVEDARIALLPRLKQYGERVVQQQVYDTRYAEIRAASADYYQSSAYTAWLKRADAYLERTLLDFDEMPTPAVALDLFDGRLKVDALDPAALRETVPGISPIAAVRQLVAHERLPFHMSRMEKFARFAERYRQHVMA